MNKPLTLALAGNPNSGKTTLFNALTGSRQHVGNYPGVTVEKVEGRRTHKGRELKIVDLPGTYSLSAHSVEELVARDYLVDEAPDVVIDIVDASNIERNLYLAVQLIELRVPLMLAFNMSDVAAARGFEFDLKRLSELLGVPIVPTIGNKGKGIDALLDAAVEVAGGGGGGKLPEVHYGPEIEAALGSIEPLLEGVSAGLPRWTALKLLENDKEIVEQVGESPALEKAQELRSHLASVLGDTLEIIIADRRYGFISGACQETVKSTVDARHQLSDRVDVVLAHRILGLPIFLGLLYLVFQFVFTLGGPPMEWIETFFGWSAGHISSFWPEGSDSPLRSLLVDGVIGGVGGVVVFLPNIMLLFLAIALLEDSGYMARAAFVMDHIMHRFNLHGKSFVPMVIGFGCTVPAIMATRTLESPRDRLTTMLVAPLMSCGARLPIYALIIPAFFPQAWQAPMLLFIYLIGVVLALVCAKLLRKTILRGESTPFVMELPPYRWPTVRGTLMHTWHRSWLYLRKAGTIILGISIVLWALTSYPKKPEYDRDYASLEAAATGQYLATVAQTAGLAHIALPPETLASALEGRTVAGELPNNAVRLAALTQRIERIRANFEARVEEGGFEAGSAGYALARQVRDNALNQARQEAPVLFEAAAKYLDEAVPAYTQTRASLANAKAQEELTYTLAGRIGKGLEPVLQPMGFDWRIGTALIGAFAAKEVFVAQLGIVYSVGEAGEGSEALRDKLRANYSPLVAFCVMLFCLISAPCVATIAVTRSESNSWGWALFQLGGLTALAWILTAAVYQIGRLVGG